MDGVLPFQLVRRKRPERAVGSKNEDLPSSKRSRQGLWIVNNSLEMSVVTSKVIKGAKRSKADGDGAVERCSCCRADQHQHTPRRSSRLARKKGDLPSAVSSCRCSRRTAVEEDKENHPSEDPLCVTPTAGCRVQRGKSNEFSLLIDTWGMELQPPLRTRQSIAQKATRTSASTTSTPRGARCTTSPQQASSPTSELAAQLQDLVFSSQQVPGRQPTSPPPQHATTPGNHTRVLRSKRQVPQVKAKENSCVVLEVKRGLSKCESNSCSVASDSVGSGSQAVATKEEGKVVAGEGTGLTLRESSAVDRNTRSKEGEDPLPAGSSSPLPKEASSPRTPTFTDESAFELLCRDKELAALESFLKKHVCGRQSGSLYVSGPPGTGKSASINHLLDNRPDLTANASVVVLNCMTLRSPQAIFSCLLEQLQPLAGGGRGKLQMKSAQDRLAHIITHSKKIILLVLDEMDQLDSKGQEILYSIFEWSSLPTSQLVLIGIANALDLTDRILPRLQMRPKCRPQLLNFPPYDKDQLVLILEQKLPSLLSSDVTFDPSAVQFCARKVSSVHGDLRKAVDICRRSVEVLEARRRQDKGLEPASCQPRVSIPLVAEVIGEVYGARMVGGAQDTFPLQQKMAICTLLMLVRGKALKEVELGKLHSAYVKVCQKRKLKFESESEFVDVCSMLQSRGVLSIKKAKERRLAKVTLNLQESEVSHALQDTALLSSVLEAGL